jgi:hypothetical protein
MRDGTVQQVDTPQTLYRSPPTCSSRRFIGSPSMNLVDADAHERRRALRGFRVPARPGSPPTEARRTRDPRHPAAGLRRSPDGRTPAPVIEVEVAVVEELGSATHVLFTIDAPPVDVDSVRAASDDGERAILLATDRRAFFTAELPEGTVVRPGERIRLAVDPGRFHFFDPETGATLRPGALRRDRLSRSASPSAWLSSAAMAERLSPTLRAVSDAVLAVAAEVSVDDVLQRLVDSSRELAGARYAALGCPTARAASGGSSRPA